MTMLSLLVVSAAATSAPQGVLLDFTASWCGPCQQMSPVVSRLIRQGYPIRKVDVDREPELAQKYGVSSIPAFVLVVDGQVADRIVGKTTEGQLRQLLARIPNEKPNGGSQQAQGSGRASDEVPQQFLAPRSKPRGTGVQFVDEKSSNAKFKGFQLPFFGKKDDGERTIDDPFLASAEDAPQARSRASESSPTSFSREPASFSREPTASASPADQRTPDTDRRATSSPLGASVRIRVRNEGAVNLGSGTIVDSRPGRSIVLTCGHIFRDLRRDASIEVDAFDGERHETFAGQVVRYDLQADVGLIAIATQTVLPVARVASRDGSVAPGERVVSVGCGGGKLPTVQQLSVTGLNRNRGQDYVECTGVPVQGRSGGGLFDRSGQVIGVCFAADPKQRRGLYAGLRAVHDLLDRAELSHLYRHGEPALDGGAAGTELARSDFTTPGSSPPAGGFDEAGFTEERPASETEQPPRGDRQLVVDEAQLAQMRAALTDRDDGIDAGTPDHGNEQRRPADAGQRARSEGSVFEPQKVEEVLGRAEDAEVVCIIRPLNGPQSASRVVIINRASAKFVKYLEGELRQQVQPTMQSYRLEGTQDDGFLEPQGVHDADIVAANRGGLREAAPATDPPRPYRRSAASR